MHCKKTTIVEATFKKTVLYLVFGALASQAAIIYDLKSSFSNTANPNGAFSYVQGTTLLPQHPQPAGGINSLDAAAANGYFGVGNNFSTAPLVLQVSQNGGSTSGYSNNDFLTGDIIGHSTNSGAGAPLFIDWTAPTAGTITYTGSVWYAHSPVARSNDYFLMLGSGPVLATGTVSYNNNFIRSNPSNFASSVPLTVTAGQVLALELMPTAGQNIGSLAGVNLTVTLNPVTSQTPEPATTLLLVGGLSGIAWLRKYRISKMSRNVS